MKISHRSFGIKTLLSVLLLVLTFNIDLFGQSNDSLLAGFLNPPADAYPRTWWHWTRSNVSKEGITKDLEWMKRAGIAGFQLADVNAGGGQTVKDPIVFGTEQWYDAVKFAANEADRLGLEMAIFSSPGWSLTGAPWVKPEQAMKKLVWSVVEMKGPIPNPLPLPVPPSHEGPGPSWMNDDKKRNGFYRDVAVVAFRTPADENNKSFPDVSSSEGLHSNNFELFDSDLSTALTIRPRRTDGQAWIQFTYRQAISAKAITIAARRGIPFGKVSASDDGIHFKTLITLPGVSGYRGGNTRTYAFPETSARFFRFEFTNAAPRPADIISETVPAPDTAYTICEIKIHPAARINRWEEQAGFNILFDYNSVSTPNAAANSSIDPSSIIDLTSKMDADGVLKWDMPSGDWTIMRFGFALTGAKNRPAVPAALGYEVDKMNPQYVTDYMKAYTEPLLRSLGSLYGKRLRYFLMDSWEAGIQNWTDIMPFEFKKRRGYELINYLPALTGRVVGSSDMSERFLWDFRRTLIDMIAENHYGTVTNFLHQQGVKTYGEAGGVSLETTEDALLNKKYVDIPMGEFWVRDLHPSSMYYEDVRGAASSSHVYGKNLVAAEAFTGGNFESPQTLKTIADYWFTQGINRLVFHTSAHQPLDTRPGNTMVGTHLHRNITWAEQVKPLTTYFARNSYLLQQGHYVADIAYLLNEGAPSTMPFWGGGLQPAMPAGYQFDYINADVLLNRMSVNEQGKLVLPDGMMYSLLVLPNTSKMTWPMLQKIKQLVAGGAVVVGPKPVEAPGLSQYPASDSAIKELSFELWDNLDGVSRTKRNYGKGKIVWGLPLSQLLGDAGVSKDASFNYSGDKLSWIHRRSANTDIYLIVNRTDKPLDLSGRFRVTGKEAELWHADNGSVKPVTYLNDSAGTNVQLPLGANEAVFVIFRNKASQNTRTVAAPQYTELKQITGTWDLSFPPGLGAPEKATMDSLTSWTESNDEGVKYFSGTATYTTTFEFKKKWAAHGTRILLDLGDVKDIADVFVNKIHVDLLWKSPFVADVTNVVKNGGNVLQIQVTNEWTNRLAGDNLNPDKKVLDSYPAPFGQRQYDLKPSGLVGPVKLIRCKGCNN